MATIDIVEGLDDTDEGITLGVSGDDHPRIHLTPQGLILTGDGSSEPTDGLGSLGSLPATEAGVWYGAPGPTGSNAVTLNLLMMHQIRLAPGTRIDRVGCEVTSGTASAVVRMGVWTPNAAGQPSGLLHQTPTPHDASSPAVFQDVVDLVVPPSGLLVVGAVAQGALPTFRTFAPGYGSTNAANDVATIASHTPGAVGYDAGESGALPDTPAVSHGSATFFPRIWLRSA